METNFSVKTAEAAKIVGLSYDGFRSWLKRGFLKEAGILPQFQASHVPAREVDGKRWTWSSFGYSDLCSFRLAKVMLDGGLPWKTVCEVAGHNDVWQSHRAPSPENQLLAIFPRHGQWTLYSSVSLAEDLQSGAIKTEWMSLVDLHELREGVKQRLKAHSDGEEASNAI